MKSRILALLMHYANANPPYNRTEFYALKDCLLHRYATFHGHDLQIIKKECWGENYKKCGPKCGRCGGTGIFDVRWVRLERWQWGRFLFHKPTGDTRIKPDSPPESWIHGRIDHPNYGRLSNEAVLWLYLLAGEWRSFRHALRSSCCCGWYAWPLLNVQRVVMNLHTKFVWRKCFGCKRWFPTWGSGWQVCHGCWRKPQEIPF